MADEFEGNATQEDVEKQLLDDFRSRVASANSDTVVITYAQAALLVSKLPPPE